MNASVPGSARARAFGSSSSLPARLGAGLWLIVAGACATTGAASPAEDPASAPGAAAVPPPVREPPSPQSTAADALVEQGRQLHKKGRNEAALGRLERAMSLNPRHGAGHYWLAEVWRAKGNAEQAREHHRLAQRYLSGRAEWADRVAQQGAALK